MLAHVHCTFQSLRWRKKAREGEQQTQEQQADFLSHESDSLFRKQWSFEIIKGLACQELPGMIRFRTTAAKDVFPLPLQGGDRVGDDICVIPGTEERLVAVAAAMDESRREYGAACDQKDDNDYSSDNLYGLG